MKIADEAVLSKDISGSLKRKSFPDLLFSSLEKVWILKLSVKTKILYYLRYPCWKFGGNGLVHVTSTLVELFRFHRSHSHPTSYHHHFHLVLFIVLFIFLFLQFTPRAYIKEIAKPTAITTSKVFLDNNMLPAPRNSV